MFREVLLIVVGGHVLQGDVSIGIDAAQQTVVQFQIALFGDHPKVAGWQAGKAVHKFPVLRVVVFHEIQDLQGPGDHGVHIGDGFPVQEKVPFPRRQGLVDPAGQAGKPVDLLAGNGLDQFLPELAHEDPLARQLRVIDGNGHDIPLQFRGIHPEEQVRRCQVKEMERMGLKDLGIVEQPAEGIGRT